ncbi:AAA family ATPase [Streptomyces sp. NPDC006879]|uniref:AAA family ATPase n=1 Tax=Streptomyces sp. NPDC006879 TaxID=3364767 RepID=UPI0036B47F2F
MRLHRLTVTAFGPFGGTEEIDFDSLSAAGLYLLHGPTGAGKTSVLDAVCYALYGTVPGARQAPAANLRSDHATADTLTEVLLDLTVGGRRLEITRRPEQARPKKRGKGTTREKAQSWLREHTAATGWTALSRSHQEIGEEISQLIGMNKEQFCQVVLLPQGEFQRFLRADAADRGRLLGRLFDTSRFAAVETRLAEQRRAAESRVRAGDECVLAIVQRMAQAAGDVVEMAPPELAPAEPGLAGEVRSWAAIARCGARERHTVTAHALGAARRRHAVAVAALDQERELERLQRRHAEASRRQSQLNEQEEELKQVRRRLERARQADRVAPALALHQAAEREWRAATDAYARCAATLDADLAEAGAEQLAQYEQRLRQELGALQAARRDELRSAEITEERRTLEREARQAEELLAEGSAWLNAWEDTHNALLDRASAAEEAAGRTERLAARLEPAQRQLAAARRRDHLDAQVSTATIGLLAARESAAAAREHWLELKEARLLGIAAELAVSLSDGTPCAVCGSLEHPAPARPGASHVDRAAEEAARAAYERSQNARVEAENKHTALSTAHQSARDEAGDGSAEALQRLVEELTDDRDVCAATASDLAPARADLARAEREHQRRVTERHQAEQHGAARMARREQLDRELAALEAVLATLRADAPSVGARATALAARAVRVGEAARAAGAAEATALRLKAADDGLAHAAFEAGFDTPAAAAAAVLPQEAFRALQARLDEWNAECAAVADRLAEPGTAAAAERPPARPAAAEASVQWADQQLRAASSSADAARERCDQLDHLSARAEETLRELGPLRAQYERVARLAALTAGTSTDNERRMRLESYVLAARLEQVAAAATVRLGRMSAGRYTLVHSDARVGGRGRSGLGLHVVDAWTGRERDTASLSGGETFFVSLALALGLADVVTDEAGGLRLDTLFIDEGFGSLDEQTLDEVLDVLDSLRERDRSVGIVSHVADLRRRIHAQLEVVKGRTGSVVRQRGTGAGRHGSARG